MLRCVFNVKYLGFVLLAFLNHYFLKVVERHSKYHKTLFDGEVKLRNRHGWLADAGLEGALLLFGDDNSKFRKEDKQYVVFLPDKQVINKKSIYLYVYIYIYI